MAHPKSSRPLTSGDNMCYLNSVLQSLVQILDGNLDHGHHQPHFSCWECKLNVTMRDLRGSTRRAYEPRLMLDLVKERGNTGAYRLQMNVQCDANEMLNLIIETCGLKVFRYYFQEYDSETRLNRGSLAKENAFVIPLERDQRGVLSTDGMFLSSLMPTDSKAYKRIVTAPEYAVLHIQRCYFKKNEDNVLVYEKLNNKVLASTQLLIPVGSKDVMYDLVGFVGHQGTTLKEGHYLTYLWNEEEGNFIVKEDDLPVRHVIEYDLSEPYMVFYKIRDEEGGNFNAKTANEPSTSPSASQDEQMECSENEKEGNDTDPDEPMPTQSQHDSSKPENVNNRELPGGFLKDTDCRSSAPLTTNKKGNRPEPANMAKDARAPQKFVKRINTMNPVEIAAKVRELEEDIKRLQKEHRELKIGKLWTHPDVRKLNHTLCNKRRSKRRLVDPKYRKHYIAVAAESHRKCLNDPIKGPARRARLKEAIRAASKREIARRQTDNDFRLRHNAKTNAYRPKVLCPICHMELRKFCLPRHMKRHDKVNAMLKSMSEEEAKKMERSTIPTINWRAWAYAHLYTITGSMCRGITNMKPSTNPSRMIKRVIKARFYPNETTRAPGLALGRVMEDVAAEWYKCLYPTRNVGGCGVFPFTKLPFLRSTPDRVVDGNRTLEVKCPLTSTLEKVKWLKKTNGKWELKRATQYYDQVAMHLLCSGREFCDLIVYINPREFFVREYNYSEMAPRMKEIIKKSLAWYCKNITHTVPPPTPEPKRTVAPTPRRAYVESTRTDANKKLTDDERKVTNLELEVLLKLCDTFKDRKFEIPPEFETRRRMLEMMLGLKVKETEYEADAEVEDDFEYDSDPREICESESDMDESEMDFSQ